MHAVQQLGCMHYVSMQSTNTVCWVLQHLQGVVLSHMRLAASGDVRPVQEHGSLH